MNGMTNGLKLKVKGVDVGGNCGWIQWNEVEVNLSYLMRERRTKARDEV